jgi:hypothetical protein
LQSSASFKWSHLSNQCEILTAHGHHREHLNLSREASRLLELDFIYCVV